MISFVETLISSLFNKKNPKIKPDNSINGQFIIHMHDAKKAGLHFDIRLGHDGVLKSWATKKFLDLLSGESKKILTFEVPDHDASWFNFNGDIEDGYGAGKVSIWDKGTFHEITWEPNHITIIFNGTKLKGKFTFVLYKKETLIDHKQGNKWLLLKSK